MILALVFLFSAAIAFGVYYKTLTMGFLLDDFYHIDYLVKAFDGENRELLRAVFGSWTSPLGLDGYRPMMTVGLLLDFAFWKVNPFGYHLTNLLVFSGCCICVAALVYKLLAGRGWIQYAASGVAGALFALYPIHPVSVAWVFGRVDSQCILFFLLALLGYFQFRQRENRLYLVLSFVSFFISLATSEHALVLPAVILFAELLLAGDLNWKEYKLVKRLVVPLSYFIFLAVFFVVRTSAVGSLSEGFGGFDFKSAFESFERYFNLASAKRIFAGVDEGMMEYSDLSRYACISIALAFVPVVLAILSKRNLRLYAFLAIFIAISLLPSALVWQVFPSLEGSRLFFLGSAPFVILISVAAFSPFENLSDTLKKVGFALRAVASVSLICLAGVWYTALGNNLDVWLRASQNLEAVRNHLTELAVDTKSGELIHLIDLPGSQSGKDESAGAKVGLIGTPEQLRSMLRLSKPPLSDEENVEQIVTSELLLSSNRDLTYPFTLERLLLATEVRHNLAWDSTKRAYESVNKHELGLFDLVKKTDGSFLSRQGDLPLFDNGRPGPNNLPVRGNEIRWFKVEKMSPFMVAWIKFPYKSESGTNINARLIFKSTKQSKELEYLQGPQPEVSNGSELLFVPYRNRSWLLNGDITEIGIKFESLDKPLELEPKAFWGDPLSIFPLVELHDASFNQSVARSILLPCDSLSPLRITYDARSVKGAKGVKVMVGVSDKPIADLVVDQIPDQEFLLFEKNLNNLTGTVEIPDELIVKAVGIHQVCVIALDDKQEPVGYLSEPKMFEICPGRLPQIK